MGVSRKIGSYGAAWYSSASHYNDPLSIAVARLLWAVVTLLAGYIPARRAAGYDPVWVWRYEHPYIRCRGNLFCAS
jgi:hypothetical protein